jgi:cyclopropane-fatty-acyl-phospholipid synthase
MLPSPQVLKSLGEKFGVAVIRERIFEQNYAKTLAIWRSNFRCLAQPDAIKSNQVLTHCKRLSLLSRRH